MPEGNKPVEFVEVPISAPGPTQKLVPNEDGTMHVIPGKAHEARKGVPLAKGVKTVGVGEGTDPRCPVCREPTLKRNMRRKEGQRIYCSNQNCGYDQAKPNQGVTRGTKIVSGSATAGVKVLRQGPSGQ